MTNNKQLNNENVLELLTTTTWVCAEDIKSSLKLKDSVKTVGKLLAVIIGKDPRVECKKINNVRHYRLKGPVREPEKKVTSNISSPDTNILEDFVSIMKDALEYRAIKQELIKFKEQMGIAPKQKKISGYF